MSEKRSGRLMLIGGGVFVVGAVVTAIALRSGDGPAAAAPRPRDGVAAPAVQPTRIPKALARTKIPKGKQAVAVQLPLVPGLAGYALPGDRVNVYAAVKNGQPNTKLPPPLVKLVLPNVAVIDVRVPQGGGDSATYLLALDEKQAERLIFFAKYESLWMSLVRTGETSGKTGGRAYKNAL